MSRGVLAILGSGETAPGMTKIHRMLFEGIAGDVRAVNIDTAYGFQENIPQMTEKLTSYFQTSLQTTVKPLGFASYAKSDELSRAIFKQEVRDANYVFAGPGSPSYAIDQWLPLGLADDLTHVLASGGTLCFSSAAAATIGAFSPPVYEIYKVGAAPYWNPGMDLLSNFGLDCVVIPHFDNAEGGNYDTSCCYLGLRRLTLMDKELPPHVSVLGVDEHTALVLDLEDDSLRILGRSRGYWRRGANVKVLENGSVTNLGELRTRSFEPIDVTSTESEPITTSNEQLAQRILDGAPNAVESLAQLVRRSESGGEGRIDPTTLIEGVLAAREKARAAGQYELADDLRDALVKASIDVHDGPSGSTWSLQAP